MTEPSGLPDTASQIQTAVINQGALLDRHQATIEEAIIQQTTFTFQSVSYLNKYLTYKAG